ncbi:hypothetical protein M514_09706 [Trichuris suis]|uniref:Uncharacterized protein n=1 Tax=Trichuris suis TaxID=68888 RepID=A0A085N2F8_9BILA|nr:hypothetical protein M513_09706 [Trichuris suis]KFD63654.1 hypothetical protein M514_09706 [Trichuris suis]
MPRKVDKKKERKVTKTDCNLPAKATSSAEDEGNVGKKEGSVQYCSCCGYPCSLDLEWQKCMKKICDNIEQLTRALMEEKLSRRKESEGKPPPSKGDANDLRTAPTADDGTSSSGFETVGLATVELDRKRQTKESLLDKINSTINKKWNAFEKSENSYDRTETFADNAGSWESLFVMLVLTVFAILLAFMYGGIPGVTFNSGVLLWRQL